jgi:plastocyanin
MSRSRSIAVAPVAGLLCALGVLAAPALVAGAAGAHTHAHTREHHASAPRASTCHRNSRRRRHHHRRCRIALHTAKRSTGASGAGGASTGIGASAPTTPPASGTVPGVGASSPSGEPASTSTEAPTVETPAAPARVQVIAKEYSFTLSRAEVPAGKVIVEFVNGGEDPHNLHLEEPTESVEAGAFPTSSPGFHGDLTLNLRPGTYTLFCSLPGHEAKGMKATLTVH